LGEGHAGSKTLWICRCAWTTIAETAEVLASLDQLDFHFDFDNFGLPRFAASLT
jgi:hypothetical protein